MNNNNIKIIVVIKDNPYDIYILNHDMFNSYFSMYQFIRYILTI